ncbi:MAG: TetR/AcrR family transcriptional regulator [Lysobacterales bacterium]|jgi:AcrR family transcriptional regulator
MTRRPRDAEATRKAILEVAEQLFVEEGFGSTSMARIAKACGCANSLIVHHFGSKEGLWNEVKERAFASFVEENQRLFSDQPVSVAGMRQTTEAYFHLLKDNPRLVQLLLRAEMERDPKRSRMNTRQLEPFVARMHEAQEAGILRDDVPAAYLLLILINVLTRWFEARHLFSGWEALGAGDADRKFLDGVYKVFFEGALTPAAREGKA